MPRVHVGFGVCAEVPAGDATGGAIAAGDAEGAIGALPIFESRGGGGSDLQRFSATGLRGTPLCYTRGLAYIAARFPTVALPYDCDLGIHWTDIGAQMDAVRARDGNFAARVASALRAAPLVPWVLAFRTERGEHHGNTLLLVRAPRPLLLRYEPRGSRYTSYSHERLDAVLRRWARDALGADYAGPTDFQRHTGPQSLEVVEAASRAALPDVGTCALWSLFFAHCYATRFEEGADALAVAQDVSDWIDDRFSDEFDVSMCIQAYGKLIEAEVADVAACDIL